jgi:hypothetical protein
MRPIPQALRRQLAEDPFMSRCCITGSVAEKIDWHHNLIFAGRQVNEAWAILPLARSIHDRVFSPEIKERCDWIMLNRATDDQLRPYCRVIDYIALKKRLNAKFGTSLLKPRELPAS